jgi:hypothetical protein
LFFCKTACEPSKIVYNRYCNEGKTLMSKPQNITFRSTTARLLATENITVNQSNSTTAWFDVEKRILNLPMWDVEDYVYDMLVGHEVGHALYTPAEGWHDSITDLEIPRSYINVVEDARIEKLIKRQYPGLVNTFSRAYNWMNKNDFFKVKGRDLYKMNLIDRINCEFKLGAGMDVPFAPEEQRFVDMTAQCETFQDVVDTCKAIMEFWKENKDEMKSKLAEMQEDQELDDEIDAESEEGSTEYSDGDDSEASEDAKSRVRRFSQDREDAEVASGDDDMPSTDGSEGDSDESETDNALRSNESSLIKDADGSIIKFFPRSIFNTMIMSADKYHTSGGTRNIYRRSRYREWNAHHTNSSNDVKVYDSYDEFCSAVLYKKFMNETNRVVSYLAKEFEQKKAAYQYSRAKVSTSGVLNTSALHKYKFSEDVFKRTMTLADAKSHGMIITLDFSGSMGDVLYDTVTQALNLAMFCRRVNIPFEMYTFTAGGYYSATSIDEKNVEDKAYESIEGLHGTVLPRSCNLTQLFSSKMSKRQFDNAVKEVFLLACGLHNSFDGLGSTPTNETLMALKYVIEDFQSRHRVQKLINVLLTDGEPNNVHFTMEPNTPWAGRHRGSLQLKGHKYVRIDDMNSDLSAKLLDFLRTEYKVVNLGYFLGDSSSMRKAIANVSDFDYAKMEKVKSELRKYGSSIHQNVMGYDQYFLVKSSKFGIQDDDFEVGAGASKKELAKEFSKFAKGRRQSRVLLDKFIKTVA